MRGWRRAAAGVLGLYVLYALIGIAVHPQFIYPFDPRPFAMDGYEMVTTPSDAGVVSMATAPGVDDAPAVLFFMGNTGALSRFPSAMTLHRDAGRHVVAMEYPGGGGRPGAPSEAALKVQALAAYDWMDAKTDQDIILHGYSLGTSLALYVASERDVNTVLLDAPFVRMCEQMARQSSLPACWLPGVQKWDSSDYLDGITADIQIQHGEDDTLVPLSDGMRLADMMRVRGIRVDFLPIAGGDHNNLFRQDGYGARVAGFIAAQSK